LPLLSGVLRGKGWSRFTVSETSYNHRTFLPWCQGQDSNLRSPSGQRFYRPSVLATHPPWLCPRTAGEACPAPPLQPPELLEPEGGFDPSTYRLQIGCAAVAPLGRSQQTS